MRRSSAWPGLVVALLFASCGGSGDDSPAGQKSDAGAEDGDVPDADAGVTADASEDGDAPDSPSPPEAAPDATPDADCGTPTECALADEKRASDAMNGVLGDPNALGDFLKAMPKGGDLHNHLSGAIYAETYLDWAESEGGYCITNSTLSLSTSCANSACGGAPSCDPDHFGTPDAPCTGVDCRWRN